MFSTRHARRVLRALLTLILTFGGTASVAADTPNPCLSADVLFAGEALNRPASAAPADSFRLEAPADSLVIVELSALETRGSEPFLLLFPADGSSPPRTLGSGPRAHALIVEAGDAVCLIAAAADPAGGLPAYRLSTDSMPFTSLPLGIALAGDGSDPSRDGEPDGREGVWGWIGLSPSEDGDPSRDGEPDGQAGLRLPAPADLADSGSRF